MVLDRIVGLKPLQFFCNSLPSSFLADKRQ